MLRLIKFLLKMIFGISFYESPVGLPVTGRLRSEHFYSAEYRNDLSHDIPKF